MGDDLYVTNPERLQKGIEEHSSNAILIAPNQIETVSETSVIQMACKPFGLYFYRSGETSDDIIVIFLSELMLDKQHRCSSQK